MSTVQLNVHVDHGPEVESNIFDIRIGPAAEPPIHRVGSLTLSAIHHHLWRIEWN